jgi:hypothetical protein
MEKDEMPFHLLLLVITPTTRAAPEDFHVEFAGKQSLPAVFAPVGPKLARWIHLEPEGLRIKLSAERDRLGPVALAANIAVRGDFEITAGYEILQADASEKGYGVGVALTARRVPPVPLQIRVGWLARKDRDAAVWDRTDPSRDDKLKFMGGAEPHTARAGRLRLKRVGTTVQFLIAAGLKSEEFRAIKEMEFGSEDVEQISLVAMTGKQPYALDARWVDLHISADALPALAQPGESSSRALLLLLALACIGVLVGGAVFVRWKRAGGPPVNCAESPAPASAAPPTRHRIVPNNAERKT